MTLLRFLTLPKPFTSPIIQLPHPTQAFPGQARETATGGREVGERQGRQDLPDRRRGEGALRNMQRAGVMEPEVALPQYPRVLAPLPRGVQEAR